GQPFHVLPGDVRDHHRSADFRRDRRADAVFRIRAVHLAVGDCRLQPGCALGLGRRVSGQDGRARLRGGTVVHVNAGIAALVAALCVGRRQDFKAAALLPHNVPFTLLGAGLLWFGWFGFNAGSALAGNGSAALAFTTTMLAPAGTLVVWTILDALRQQKTTAVGAATGIVVGLVAVRPAAGFIGPMSAIALGAFAAIPSYFGLLW